MLLKTYIKGYRLVTVPDIINRWAPATENLTEKYIQIVVNNSGIERNTTIDWLNQHQMVELFQAMCFVENGMVCDRNDVTFVYRLLTDDWEFIMNTIRVRDDAPIVTIKI